MPDKQKWQIVPVEATDRMIHCGEGMTDFVLPSGTHDNTLIGRQGEMRMAWSVMLDQAPMNDEVADALRRAMQAMNVWCCTYADDMVDSKSAAEAHEHIRNGGGSTLAYISETMAHIQNAAHALGMDLKVREIADTVGDH